VFSFPIEGPLVPQPHVVITDGSGRLAAVTTYYVEQEARVRRARDASPHKLPARMLRAARRSPLALPLV
jgi:hypothetical protein